MKTLTPRPPTFFGIILLAAIMVFPFASCDNDPGNATHGNGPDAALNGTWFALSYSSDDAAVADGDEGGTHQHEVIHEYEVLLKLNNGKYEMSEDGIPSEKGTYTTNENKITVKPTHFYGSNQYVQHEINIHIGLEAKWYSQNELEAYVDDYSKIVELFSEYTTTYFISGKTLNFPAVSYTKK